MNVLEEDYNEKKKGLKTEIFLDDEKRKYDGFISSNLYTGDSKQVGKKGIDQK